MDLSLEEQVFGRKPLKQQPNKADWNWLKQRVEHAGLQYDWLQARMLELRMPEPEFDAENIWINAMPPLVTALWLKVGDAEKAKAQAVFARDPAYAADELYSPEALINPHYRAEVLKCLST